MAEKGYFADMGEKAKKKLELAVVIGVIAIALLLLLPGFDFGTGGSDTNGTSSLFNADAEQEALRKTLSSIKGAGKVEVMITYRAAESAAVQPAGATGSYSLGGSAASQQDNAEQRPEVLGVVVVAEGAEDIGVKIALSGAVQTALGIPADRVDVFQMSK